MSRSLYALGGAYLGVCVLALVLAARRPEPAPPAAQPPAPASAPASAQYPGVGGAWFARVKPFCNAVEVDVRQQADPPPATVDGRGYGAACFALAGKIDRARALIDSLPADQRSAAAGIVFVVGHPVADAGDDRSAGPIMSLVVEYQPKNYMALYHAGMSQYAIGHPERAREHLEAFLRLYTADDGWRSNARTVLGRIEGREGRR